MLSKTIQKEYYSFWLQQQPSKATEGLYGWFKQRVECLYLSLLKRNLGDLRDLMLLEIGPGNGAFAQEATSLKVNYHAVERSSLLADKLVRKGYMIETGAFSESSFGSLQFDIIYLSHVLEHADSVTDAVNLISLCSKKLKDKGILMINTPNVLDYKFLFWLSDYTHNFVTTPLRVKGLLTDCGFDCFDEQKTVFIFKNFFLRKFSQLLFKTPVRYFLLTLLRFAGKNIDFIQLAGCENFSVLARKSASGSL